MELVQLGAWLSMFPQTGGQPATHPLPAPPDTVAGGPSFNEVRDALLRDAEELRGPVQPVSREYLRTMDRKQLVFERVDADGSVHPQVFERDTPAGWKVRDWLKQVSEW